jgi:E3 ubiquitin-protein ligase RNF144
MAAGSSSAGVVVGGEVDDFYFSVLAHGRNDDDDDDELFPISDEKYAAELQLQEVIMSSAVAANAGSSSSSPRRSSTAAAAASNSAAGALALWAPGKGECSYTSSSSSRPSTPLAAAAASLVFCKICMDAVPPSDAHRAGRGCSHAFCGGCLGRYVGTKIQERIADVRCPEERCGGALDPELCQGILPREVFERWGAALCEAMLLGSKTTYCPYKDCSATMLVDDGGVRDVAEAECPSCRRLFCARCGVAPWHAGATCAEFNRLGKGDRGKEDLLLLEMAKGKKWKRCPKCLYFVEKRTGCLHITCRYVATCSCIR